MQVVQVGYGYWGANVARKIMESPKLDMTALCEARDDRRAAARAALPEQVAVSGDYREHLGDPEVEAFVIATDTESSFAIGMDAMAAGKHVFMEKPLATTVDRTLQLNARAAERGRILHCNHLLLYNPYYRYIKQMLDAGELGDLLYIDVDKLNLGPIRKDVNALMDLAVHDVAIVDYFSGGREPLQLTAFGRASHGPQETLTFLMMAYDDFVVHIKSSWVSPVKVRQTVLAGTKKMVIFDDMKDEKVRIYDCGIDMVPAEDYQTYAFLNRRGDIHIPNIPFEDSLRNSLEYFADCVHTGRQSTSGPEPSLRVMRILERAQAELKKMEKPV